MKAVVQRVSRAEVTVAGAQIGACGPGLMILLCAMQGDTEANAAALAAKIAKVRIFRDAADKMNLSVLQTGGSALVVSQFTLAGDTSGGNRPGFSAAAPPEIGARLYEHFVQTLRDLGVATQTGQFGADMAVSLVNDGPVTLVMER